MCDVSKFQNIFLYYSFHILLICVVLSEIFIFLFTHQKDKRKIKQKRSDKGTKWLLYINFIICIYISFLFVSQNCPLVIRNKLAPHWVSYIGILCMLFGIVIRLIAVLTLKKAFTLNVQTVNEQHLITTGIYHKLRNPSYTGSIMSMVGIALSLRNTLAITLVILFCIICYSIRIHVEETALMEHFQDEFKEYVTNTFRLFPYIW